MYFFMTVLGLIMGSLLGGFGGAVVGAVLGVLLTMALKRSGSEEETPLARRETSPLSATPESSDLMRRVKALELQVSALQAQVSRLTQDAPAPPQDELVAEEANDEVAPTQPMAWPDEPEVPPVEAPPVPLEVPAATAAPEPEPEPEPAPQLGAGTGPMTTRPHRPRLHPPARQCSPPSRRHRPNRVWHSRT